MDEAQLREARARLEDERVSIEHQLTEHGVPVDGEGLEVDSEGGFSDSAHITAERSQLITLIQGLRSHHRDVVAALAKIEDGTYGTCENCGNEIPYERLEAVPAARLCVTCKSRG